MDVQKVVNYWITSAEDDIKTVEALRESKRYNDYKLAFYKKATRDYTQKWYPRSMEVFQWLKQQL